MGVKDLLKQIAKWGIVPVLGIASSVYGLVSVAKGVSTWGLPSYAWIAIGWILFAAVPIVFAYSQWKEIKKIKADPHTRWRELSKQAEQIISTIDQEITQSIDAAKLPVEGLQKCLRMVIEQIVHIDFDQITLDVTDEAKVKEWMDETMKSGRSQIEQKSNPFLMNAGTFPIAMNRCGIGIDSITNTNYKTAHDRLRQIVEERVGTAASKAYKDYLTAHKGYYSLTLLSQYLTLYFQYAETLSDELRDNLQALEPVFEVANIMSSTQAEESQGRLLIAKSTLIEDIAGLGKETNGPS